MKYIKIEKNITLIQGKKSELYEVLITSKGNKYREYFNTLEEAKEYKNNINRYEANYPHQLINDLGLTDPLIDIKYLEENFDENLDFVLENCGFNEKEIRVIIGYYKEGYNQETLALQLNVERGSISTIKNKAIYKLKHPSRLSILRYGKEYKELQDDISKIKAKLILEKETLIKLSEKVREEINEYETEFDRPIEAMELSHRAYNGLRRGGIKTLGELLEKTEEDLMKIRNMGKQSIKEIVDKVKELGFKMKKWNWQKQLKKEYDNLDDELDYELEECFNEFENSKIDLTNKIIQLDNEYKPSFLLSYTLDELKKLLHKLEQRRLKK